jgi:hypothetical protein
MFFLYYLTLLSLFMYIAQFILAINTGRDYETLTSIRLFLVPFVFAFWIMCFRIWSSNDKRVGVFFVLFFFNVFYGIYYFNKALKRGWI